MAAGGDAVARDDDGRVVFITGALPGERVRAELTEERRDYARSRLIEVLDPSPLRVASTCPELDRGCGGCQWQHVAVEGQRELKAGIAADALRRFGRIDPVPLQPTVALPPEGYRTSVRAAVEDGRAGYRRGRTHDVVTVDGCMVAHPLVAEMLVDGRYPGAHEVVLRCGARTGERLAAMVPAGGPALVPDDVRSDHLHELAAGRRWRVSARSFFQGRPDGADALAALVARAADEMEASTRAVDLYSGVGLFAGVLADRGWSVTAVEGTASSVADARTNLGEAVSVVRSDVNRWAPTPADLVVADPSRDGLRKRGVAVIAATGAARVVLVSCDPAAAGRDAGLLAAAGYDLTAVTPVDLFPHTTHVEVVAVYDSRRRRSST